MPGANRISLTRPDLNVTKNGAASSGRISTLALLETRVRSSRARSVVTSSLCRRQVRSSSPVSSKSLASVPANATASLGPSRRYSGAPLASPARPARPRVARRPERLPDASFYPRSYPCRILTGCTTPCSGRRRRTPRRSRPRGRTGRHQRDQRCEAADLRQKPGAHFPSEPQERPSQQSVSCEHCCPTNPHALQVPPLQVLPAQHGLLLSHATPVGRQSMHVPGVSPAPTHPRLPQQLGVSTVPQGWFSCEQQRSS